MKRIFSAIGNVEAILSYTPLAALLSAVLWGVLTRYITEKPAVWTTELSGMLFTWVAFIGAATAFREGRHIQVTLLVDIMPPWLAKPVRLVAQLLIIVFLVYVTYLSYVMMTKGATRNSPVMRIPFFWVYLATFLSFAAMSVTSVCRLVGAIPEPAGPHGDEVL